MNKNEAPGQPGSKKHFFFIGNDRYEVDASSLTGAQIKAFVPNLEPNTVLSLEGHGNDADQMIGDTEIVNLDKDRGPLRFTLVPPATFG